VPEQYGGKKGRCPKCNTVFTIPSIPAATKPKDMSQDRLDAWLHKVFEKLARLAQRMVQRIAGFLRSLSKQARAELHSAGAALDDVSARARSRIGSLTETVTAPAGTPPLMQSEPAENQEQPLTPAVQTTESDRTLTLLGTRIVSGITVGFALLAIILFFLPWLSISCARMEIATQTGGQIAIGDISMTEEAESAGGTSRESSGRGSLSDDDSLGADWPLLFLPIFLAYPLALGVIALAKPDAIGYPAWIVGCGLCWAALIILIIYLGAGFSAERSMDEWKAESPGRSSPSAVDSFSAAGEQLGKSMAAMVGVDRTPALYFFLVLVILACLSTGTLSYLLGRLHRGKPRGNGCLVSVRDEELPE
jgi:hypothetical protein